MAKSASTMASGDAMKRQVPGGVPRILPFVGHRDDVGVVEVMPFVIASGHALCRGVGSAGIALKPTADVVMIELLAPQQTAERLAHDPGIDQR